MKKCIALALCRPLILLLLSECLAWSQAERKRPPIIDMHLHALRVAEFGVGLGPTPAICSSNDDILWYGWDPRRPFKIEDSRSCAGTKFAGSKTDEDLMRQTLAALQRYNIHAVTSGESGDLDQVSKWRAAAPQRIIPAASFLQHGSDLQGRPLYRPISEVRRLVTEGEIAVFAEVAPQYDGMSPADPVLEPYFALAEELDIPIGLHVGEGPPGGPNREGYSQVSRQDGQSIAPGGRAHSSSEAPHLRDAFRLALCG